MGTFRDLLVTDHDAELVKGWGVVSKLTRLDLLAAVNEYACEGIDEEELSCFFDNADCDKVCAAVKKINFWARLSEFMDDSDCDDGERLFNELIDELN